MASKRHHTYIKRVLDGSVEEVYQKEENGLAVRNQERVNGNKIIMITIGTEPCVSISATTHQVEIPAR